jgi:hypothetical protein
MNAKVNLQLFKTTTFDSGALGMLAMVLHQFNSIGHYRVSILNQGRALKYISFDVDGKSVATQLNIDLAQATALKGKARPAVTPGGKSEEQTAQVVSPKGYVLFHASSGYGYSVIVSDSVGKVVFDSTKLSDNDLFALSLLEPGNYSIKNLLDSAAGEIVVSLPPEMSGQMKTLKTQYIDVSEKKFNPPQVELISSQGLVFRIKSMTRIMIAKRPLPRAEFAKARPKPMISWRKLETDRKIDTNKSSA